MLQLNIIGKFSQIGYEEAVSMRKKRIVIALGHEALGTTLPEQKLAAKKTAKAVAGLIEADF